MVTTSLDHRLVAVGLPNGVIVILEAGTGRQIALLADTAAPISNLAFGLDGRLTVGRSDGRVDILDVSS